MKRVKRYNKLVRDNIPALIAKQGGDARTEILQGENYYASLKQKLSEEVDEFLADDNAEELADILEVLLAIMRYKGIEISDVEALRQKKKDERGGFEKQIKLIEVEWPQQAADG